jgi:hypothetical protein
MFRDGRVTEKKSVMRVMNGGDEIRGVENAVGDPSTRA